MTPKNLKQMVLVFGLVAGLVPACGDSSSSTCGGSDGGGSDASCGFDGGKRASTVDGGALDVNNQTNTSAVDATPSIDANEGGEAGQAIDVAPAIIDAGHALDATHSG